METRGNVAPRRNSHFMEATVCFNAKKAATDERLKQLRQPPVKRCPSLVHRTIPRSPRLHTEQRIRLHRLSNDPSSESTDCTTQNSSHLPSITRLAVTSQIVKRSRPPVCSNADQRRSTCHAASPGNRKLGDEVLRDPKRSSCRHSSFSLPRCSTASGSSASRQHGHRRAGSVVESPAANQTSKQKPSSQRGRQPNLKAHLRHPPYVEQSSGIPDSKQNMHAEDSSKIKVSNEVSDAVDQIAQTSTSSSAIQVIQGEPPIQPISSNSSQPQFSSPSHPSRLIHPSRKALSKDPQFLSSPNSWNLVFSTAERQTLMEDEGDGQRPTHILSLESLAKISLLGNSRRDTILTLSHSSSDTLTDMQLTPFLQATLDNSYGPPEVEEHLQQHLRHEQTFTPVRERITPAVATETTVINDKDSTIQGSDTQGLNKKLDETNAYNARPISQQRLRKPAKPLHQKIISPTSQDLRNSARLPNSATKPNRLATPTFLSATKPSTKATEAPVRGRLGQSVARPSKEVQRKQSERSRSDKPRSRSRSCTTTQEFDFKTNSRSRSRHPPQPTEQTNGDIGTKPTKRPLSASMPRDFSKRPFQPSMGRNERNGKPCILDASPLKYKTEKKESAEFIQFPALPVSFESLEISISERSNPLRSIVSDSMTLKTDSLNEERQETARLSARDSERESARDPARESARDSARESARDSARESARKREQIDRLAEEMDERMKQMQEQDEMKVLTDRSQIHAATSYSSSSDESLPQNIPPQESQGNFLNTQQHFFLESQRQHSVSTTSQEFGSHVLHHTADAYSIPEPPRSPFYLPSSDTGKEPSWGDKPWRQFDEMKADEAENKQPPKFILNSLRSLSDSDCSLVSDVAPVLGLFQSPHPRTSRPDFNRSDSGEDPPVLTSYSLESLTTFDFKERRTKVPNIVATSLEEELFQAGLILEGLDGEAAECENDVPTDAGDFKVHGSVVRMAAVPNAHSVEKTRMKPQTHRFTD